MTLRADHISGGFFIAFGVLVLALSGDLPFGTLSFPGAGFLPDILAVLTILFGLILVGRASESKPFASVPWSDAKHAGLVILLTAAAVAVFDWLGFLTTDVLLIFGLLVVIERIKLIPATIYSVGVVVFTYVLFVYALKTPMEPGPFGF
jgi:tripartite tricarboxylate transporter TctB family protein